MNRRFLGASLVAVAAAGPFVLSAGALTAAAATCESLASLALADVGDPGNNRIRLHVVGTWNWIVTHEDPESYFPPTKIPMIHKAGGRIL